MKKFNIEGKLFLIFEFPDTVYIYKDMDFKESDERIKNYYLPKMEEVEIGDKELIIEYVPF